MRTVLLAVLRPSLPAVGMLFALAISPAWSQDRGAYLGASIGQAEYRDACGTDSGIVGLSGCDKTDTSWHIFGGYQFNRYLAAELGYSDLGSAKLDGVATFASGASAPVSGSAEVSAWDLSAIGSFPVTDKLFAHGRGGIYRAEVDSTGTVTTNGVPTGSASASNTNTGVILGIGLKYEFLRNFAVRGEFKRYFEVGGGDLGESDVDVISVGLVYRF